MSFEVWTDGSCRCNPGGAGGWAAIVLPDGSYRDRREISGGHPNTTNNRMELMAILEGLRETPVGADVTIHSDSQYAINCVSTWWRNWKKTHWVKRDGLPVLNVDLIEAILVEQDQRHVRYQWVRGHSGSVLNEQADRLASVAAHKYG